VEIEYIDLGEDETKEDATIPSWVPYDALHERVMDSDNSGSIMDQICNVFGYESFDLDSTAQQSDSLLNDEDSTKVYPAANGKYECFCNTLDPDCFDEGGMWSEECQCNPEEYADYVGVFPKAACPATVTTGKQYLAFYCMGGAGNTAQFNGWAAAFIPSNNDVDVGGLVYSKGGADSWKCKSGLDYTTESQWYTKAFDVSAWELAEEVKTDFPLPDNISSSNTDEGANAKFLWTKDQDARTVYCVYDRPAPAV